jgi:hypothetical protein
MPSKFAKTQSKIVTEASRKSSRFSKSISAMTDKLCSKKVANHPGQNNSYVRPEKKYDGK